MSKEFGTVSVRRGDRAREIEVLRQQYARHRESLASLAADAPTEHLAAEYNRLIREIDTAIGKLGELEGRVPSDTQPGTRPLITPPGMVTPEVSEPAGPGSAIPRIALIIAAGVIVLVLIGWLMWRASGERPSTPVVRERVETAPITPAPKPVPVAVVLTMQPHVHDYGTIRKGTRAVRQFEVTNNSDEPVVVEVARSACRCLYYANANPVAPHKKETITVTVDAAKAKVGPLHETIAVSSKKDPSVSTSFEVNAMIR